jgi:sulfatase maturation enzyme AslB (radical SAM superfamily)
MKIYALEVTSECNLKCSYCPQPNMQRKKEHMPLNMFIRALDYPHWYDVVIGHLFGEAFLHPDIETMTSIAHSKNLAFGFSTNMRDFNLDDFNKLKEKGLSWMVISYHIPEARKWHKYLTENYPDFPIMTSELEQRHDWAGQIDKNKKSNIKKNVFDTQTVAKNDCIFHKYDLVTVSSQGDIYACCLDAEGLSNQGSIFNYTPEEFAQLKNDIWFELCNSCPMTAADGELEHINANMKQSSQKVFDYRDAYFNNKD